MVVDLPAHIEEGLAVAQLEARVAAALGGLEVRGLPERDVHLLARVRDVEPRQAVLLEVRHRPRREAQCPAVEFRRQRQSARWHGQVDVCEACYGHFGLCASGGGRGGEDAVFGGGDLKIKSDVMDVMDGCIQCCRCPFSQ